MTMQTT